MMPDTIIKVFDHFSDAEKARDELLASGFVLTCVHLRARQDEDVLATGHSATSDADTVTNAVDGIFDLLGGARARAAKPHKHHSAQRGVYQLSVDVTDQQQLARASVIMKQFGGTDQALL